VPPSASDVDEVIDLPDLTLVPGLMDMEVDLVLGGPGAGLSDPVRMDPVKMGLRAVANGQRTLRAGFTTVRNLGLFVQTGGVLLDVALAKAIDLGTKFVGLSDFTAFQNAVLAKTGAVTWAGASETRGPAEAASRSGGFEASFFGRLWLGLKQLVGMA